VAKKLKEYFDKELLNLLSDKISIHYSEFDEKSFSKSVISKLDTLELKDRVKLIGQSINDHLPGNFPEKLMLLSQVLGPENKGSYGTFNDYFWQWPLSSVVEHYGQEHQEASFKFIYELTKRSTGEFAIRPFLESSPDKVLALMSKWSRDKNFHVRRLSSEGLRPLLPWARKSIHLIDRPEAVFKILKRLSNDSEKYVLTSVANHMGDMVKLNYEVTMSELWAWSVKPEDGRKWVIKHAVRHLRKKGDKEALKLTDKMNK